MALHRLLDESVGIGPSILLSLKEKARGKSTTRASTGSPAVSVTGLSRWE